MLDSQAGGHGVDGAVGPCSTTVSPSGDGDPRGEASKRAREAERRMDEKLMWVINIAREDAPDTIKDKVQGEACCSGGGGSSERREWGEGRFPSGLRSVPPRIWDSQVLRVAAAAQRCSRWDRTASVHVVEVTGTEMLHLPQPQSSLSGFLSAPTSGDAGEPQKS